MTILLFVVGDVVSGQSTFDCSRGCSNAYAPVCGVDGLTYGNACYCFCQQVAKVADGACPGTIPLHSKRITRSIGDVGLGALRQYSSSGYRFVGRLSVIEPRARGEATFNTTQAWNNSSTSDYLMRITTDGSVYVRSLSRLSSDTATGVKKAAVATSRASVSSKALTLSGSCVNPAIPGFEVTTGLCNRKRVRGRLLRAIANADNRQLVNCAVPTQRRPTYEKLCPRTAIGQLFVGESGVSCTGVMISSKHVLTAAHCVFDATTLSLFGGISFAPGRCWVCPAKANSGCSMMQPFGAIRARRVDLLGTYPSVAGMCTIQDFAVVELVSGVSGGSFMGIAPPGNCGARPYTMNLAGYPVTGVAGRPGGALYTTSCSVRVDQCAEGLFNHQCDTTAGQSGAALWTTDCNGQRWVRGLHVGAYTDRTGTWNRAITLTARIRNIINMYVAT